MTFKLGVIINPFAGIGGAVGLKGSDGQQTREKALAAGAEQLAMQRMAQCLAQVQPLSAQVKIFTAGGDMGQTVAEGLGFHYELVYQAQSEQTQALDTVNCVEALIDAGVDLILFAGGDGTARNICDVVGERATVLGVPAGCKIHSGVYAVTPAAAGRIAAKMIQGQMLSRKQADVKDIDEEAFRAGVVKAKSYGELSVPADLEYLQATKMGGVEVEAMVLDDISDHIREQMEDAPDTCFVMGSGSTVDAIMQTLGLDNTLLGVDLVKGGKVIGKDLSAKQLMKLTENQSVCIVLTVIGGQGHVLGRGNQQLSPDLIRRAGKAGLMVIATKTKLNGLQGRPLISDSGDPQLDVSLGNAITVITGYHDEVIYPLSSPGNEHAV